jgi:predicted membrane protein
MSDSFFIIIIIIILYLFSNHYNNLFFENLSNSNDFIFIIVCFLFYLFTNSYYKSFILCLLILLLILFKRSDKDIIFNYLGIEKSVFLPTFIKNFIIKFKNLDSYNISQNINSNNYQNDELIIQSEEYQNNIEND